MTAAIIDFKIDRGHLGGTVMEIVTQRAISEPASLALLRMLERGAALRTLGSG